MRREHHATGKGMMKDMEYDNVVQVLKMDGVHFEKRQAKAKCLSLDGVRVNTLPKFGG